MEKTHTLTVQFHTTTVLFMEGSHESLSEILGQNRLKWSGPDFSFRLERKQFFIVFGTFFGFRYRIKADGSGGIKRGTETHVKNPLAEFSSLWEAHKFIASLRHTIHNPDEWTDFTVELVP